MIDKSAIDPNALHFYRMLKEAGFSAYFVGGSVRDLLLGKHPKDFDIATNATPHQIKRVIPQGRIIGRRFRHVMLERGGGRYEIVTFRGPVVQAEEDIAELDDESAENQPISEPGQGNEGAPQQPDRRERRNYPDLNQFGNAEQDAIRRDFTINALFYDPDADELVDYVEGKLDVDRKIVRTIGDPMVRMEEDPIRILRAIRHKMKLGLDYDPALEAAMREKSPLLTETSKDRIREEFLKVCNDHSLGDFLSESRRVGLVPHIMPWLEGVNEESVEQNFRLLEKFKEFPTPERLSPDMGLALMMIPLVEPLVLEPYKATLQPGDKNHLPDMKYFLSCEPLRNFYLRNLRISRAQTDHLVRALFYFSRMSGLWLEQGPPRRIIGRLFQHPPAVLAAKMARLALESEGKEVPDWMKELAEYEAGKRRHRGEREGPREHGRERGDRAPRENRGPRDHEDEPSDQAEHFSDRNENEGDASEEASEAKEPARGMRLPPPDQPMVWNGPLHAPVLRPVFNEEPTIRWSRKNQTVRAFRPSGIPNQPVDHSLVKSGLVYNYKPEIEGNGRSDEEGGNGGGRERGGRNRRERGRNRGRERGERGERNENRGHEQRAERRDRGDRPDRGDRHRGRDRNERGEQQPHLHQIDAGGQHERRNNPVENDVDEDSIGNVLRPGEQPAPLMGGNSFTDYGDEDEDIDDNIGNRLDAPPTSGHVGLNGDGFLPPPRRPQNNRGGQGGGGNNRRRGRRRGRRGGGGPGRAPRGNHDTQ